MPSPHDSEHTRVVIADDYPANELSADEFLGEQRWGSCKVVLTVEQAKAVLAGQSLAVDILQEYVGFISIETPVGP